MQRSICAYSGRVWLLLLIALTLAACSGEEKTVVVERVVQPTNGKISGTVLAQGTVLANADVLVNPGGGQATTDAQGLFSFPDLVPGAYTLTVIAAGYNTISRSNVVVLAGSTTDVIFNLLAEGASPAKVIQEDETIRLTAQDFGLPDGIILLDWKSSNQLAALVNDAGLVLGVRKGKADISALRSDNGELVSLRVAVLKPLEAFGYVNPGNPSTAAVVGYAGSDSCVACHRGAYDEWKKTGHNMMVRSVNQAGLSGLSIVADANQNGVNDFIEGLDLGASPGVAPDFAQYGLNAPTLGYSDSGEYTIKIGPVIYTVAFTVGGNGYWKQRYLIRIGSSNYLSPVQYNESTRKYVPYDPQEWYDANDQPLYTDPATLVQQIDKTSSWDRTCSGCHTTGTRVAFNDTSGEWQTGYVQTSVGCEACHGPGADHPQAALQGLADKKIVNPAKLSVDDAIDICVTCHTRGESVDMLGGEHLDFPALVQNAAARVRHPDPNVDGPIHDFANYPLFDDQVLFSGTTDPSRYWGYWAEGSLGTWRGVTGSLTAPAPYQTFVASKAHHQQGLDYLQSQHGRGEVRESCAACHDSHKSGVEWDIRQQIVESDCVGPWCESECPSPQLNVAVQTKNDDNSLCLACHSNWGPFRTLCKDDVNNDPVKVGGVVKAHMGEQVLMGGVPYDPEGSALGRCSACHLVKMAKSAVTTPDVDGKQQGDVHSHTWDIVWPSVDSFIDATMPNSCSVCHSSRDPQPGLQALAQWAKAGHADVTVDHWRYAAGPTRGDCVRCHSSYGFVDFLAGLPAEDQNKNPLLHSCHTCHESQPGSPYARRPDASATFPSGFTTARGGDALLCLECHQGRTWKGTVDIALGQTGSAFRASNLNSHYLVAGAVLYGTTAQAAWEYPGKTYRAEHFHIEINCVVCHMSKTALSPDVGGHTWDMVEGTEQNRAECLKCHDEIGEFDEFQIYDKDYDGDGVVEGVGEEIESLKSTLLAAIEAKGVTELEGYPYWTPSTGGAWDGPDGPALKKAAYNYLLVKHDPGAYVHNGKFTVQLLRDSYEDLTGGALPGDRP